MTPRAAASLVALALLLPAGSTPAQEAAPEGGARFPAEVVDIDGRTLDVARIAREDHLVVITLKATWCPVCRNQLVRVRERMEELERCDARFIVLAPGPAEELRKVREETRFDAPFVVDDDLAIAKSLGLMTAPGQIFPCMFEITAELGIGWRQLGRNGAYFGDAELSEFFDCVSI